MLFDFVLKRFVFDYSTKILVITFFFNLKILHGILHTLLPRTIKYINITISQWFIAILHTPI